MSAHPCRHVWRAVSILLPLGLARSVAPADCNANGIDDAIETAPAGFGFRLRAFALVSGVIEVADLNSDGVVDLLAYSFDQSDPKLFTHLGTSQLRFQATSAIGVPHTVVHSALG